MDDILRLFHHLAFGYPQRGLGDGYGKVIYLNTVELADGDLDGAAHVKHYLPFIKLGDDLIFKATQRKICFSKEVARAAGGVYVPTDFDTIEKAFSGVKTAEKGIKQGLSRSITDSESPFSLYSVVDFCRSKVRRHRGV